MRRTIWISALVMIACVAGRLSAPQGQAGTVVVSPPEVHIHMAKGEEDALPAAPLPGWPDKGRPRFALKDAPGVLTAWSGVVAAAGAPVLAAWNSEVVMWSGDEGATWTRHSLTDGQRITAAAAEEGWVHLLVDGERDALWSFSPSGTRTVRSAPLDVPTTVVLSGGFGKVAVLGSRVKKASNEGGSGGDGVNQDNGAAKAVEKEVEKEVALLISSDHGATWQDAPAPELGNAGNKLEIEANGALVYMWGMEAACGGGGQYRARLAAGAKEWETASWPLDTPFNYWLGAGWAYGVGDCRTSEDPGKWNETRLCAVGAGDERATAGPEVQREANAEVVSNGRVTYAIAGAELFTVKGGVFKRVASTVPRSMEVGAAVDSGGRVVGVAAGRIVRWSAAGWEVLLPG